MTDQTMKASYIKGSTNIKGIQNDNDRYEKRIKELQSRLKKNNTTQGSRDNSLGNQNSYVSVKNTGSKVNQTIVVHKSVERHSMGTKKSAVNMTYSNSKTRK